MFLNVDGGHSRVYNSDTSQRVQRRCFLALMVDAPGSPAPAPPRGPTSTFLSVDGGRCLISGTVARVEKLGGDVNVS
jgi:hypothetical protein